MRVSEIRVKRIRVNQGLGVLHIIIAGTKGRYICKIVNSLCMGHKT